MARIAVVDDYPEFIELMTSILDVLSGHEVIGFHASEATVDRLADAHPDLVIIDLEAADKVLGIGAAIDGDAHATLGPIPAIVCSGDIAALRGRADEFFDLGNVDVLEKPFTLDMLTDSVDEALYRSRGLI
jgi:CheY-like chemotaxis protein